MNTPLRIGIVGCGGIANAHVDAYKLRNDVAIAAVYDVSPTAAERMAKGTGAKIATSIEQMAHDMALDAVSICTPTGLHAAHCMPFLDAGLAILCEKPIATNPETAADIARRAAQNKAPFMVGFCHRFHGPLIEMKRLIDSGQLGRPLLFRNIFCTYTELVGNHRTDLALSGGGIILDNCSHSVDLFRHLVGEPDAVFAMAGNVVQDVPLEDFGLMGLSIGNNTFGEISSSYSIPAGSSHLECFGSEGSAWLSYWNKGQPDLAWSKRGERERTEVDCSAHPQRFHAQINHFIECIHTGETPCVTAEDGLAASRIVAAAYVSIREGRRVPIAAASGSVSDAVV